MKKTVVINVVGLTRRLIGEHTPFIREFTEQATGALVQPVLPAVTCSAQSTYLTGEWPEVHGIVGNGWYFRDECEVKFWRQSNKLVQSEKIWDELKRELPGFTCANMFWWYNMYSTVYDSVTPRPNYLADGRKIPDIYSHPAGLRDMLQKELGTFPLFHFWGPKTSVKSSRWIADASIRTDQLYDPTLTLIYLPHLDYNLQRHGINEAKISRDLNEIDGEVRRLVDYYSSRDASVILLSEYGITNVERPVHLNRMLREAGLLAIREERGLELLDAGASKAFAVADHQVAHIYINDPAVREEVRQLVENVPGVDKLLEGKALQEAHMAHSRSGEMVAVADASSWFTYYFWLDDKKAPDYARMVDIHKKPGYDPVEMFTDPSDLFVVPKIAGKLAAKKLGFRTVMDVIPLKSELVRGSHGRIPDNKADFPVLYSNSPDFSVSEEIAPTEVREIIRRHVIS